MKLETLKNCITGLIALLICQIIFFIMNETVAALLIIFGLSIVGLYIYRLINYMRDRTWRLYSKWKQEHQQK